MREVISNVPEADLLVGVALRMGPHCFIPAESSRDLRKPMRLSLCP